MQEIYISGMKSLAELSAKTVEIFHKIGQRIVLNSNLEVEVSIVYIILVWRKGIFNSKNFKFTVF